MTAFDVEGHRGARGLAPENTLPGFAKALEIGVDTLEMDLGVTKDGVLVVSHDQALNPDHTRDADGHWIPGPGPAIHSLTLEELKRYDVGRLRPWTLYSARFPDQVGADRVPIPTLREVFELVKQSGNTTVGFNIETKIDPGHPARTVAPGAFVELFLATVREAGMSARVILQSFDWRTLRYCRCVAPEIATSCLTTHHRGDDNVQFGRPPSPWLDGLDQNAFVGSVPRLVKAADAAIWSPDASGLSAAQVEEAHGLGLRVIPWTVNDPKRMRELIAAGVDGLISDRPDRLRAVVDEGFQR